MAVALRAHAPLPDRCRAPGPERRGVGIGPEHRDLAGLEPAVAKRRVRGEAGEPGADDRDGLHAT